MSLKRNSTGPGEITALLRAGSAGDRKAMSQAFSGLYAVLRLWAERALVAERHSDTLEADALIAEAYLRLIELEGTRWNSRQHFISVVSHTMRRILVDQARRRAAAKRGPAYALPFDEEAWVAPDAGASVVAVNDALELLRQVSREYGEVVELRFFGGLTNQEIAARLGISVPTVERRWRFARDWLYHYLTAVTS